jgi:hypothetical protein
MLSWIASQPTHGSKVYRDRSSDRHALGPVKIIEAIMEIKNKFGATDSDPTIEFSVYYVQSLDKP